MKPYNVKFAVSLNINKFLKQSNFMRIKGKKYGYVTSKTLKRKLFTDQAYKLANLDDDSIAVIESIKARHQAKVNATLPPSMEEEKASLAK